VGEPAVTNASPLISPRTRRLRGLASVTGDRVLVPEPVAREIRARGPQDITARALESTQWLQIVDPPEVPAFIQAWDLGPGESAVLAWAYAHVGAEAIIDDLAARRCAMTFRIPFRGTLGLVLAGKRRGRFPLARPVLEDLRRGGMYLSDRTLDKALALVGE
jgi:predicted nucleic acid-binding protein